MRRMCIKKELAIKENTDYNVSVTTVYKNEEKNIMKYQKPQLTRLELLSSSLSLTKGVKEL